MLFRSLEVERATLADGSKAARLRFDNVAVDADAVVGEVDGGWAPLSRALNAGRAGAAAELVGVAWVGFDQPKTILSGGYAGDVAVPLWGRFMRAATKGDKPAWFPTPKGLVGVQVCRVTGLLPDAGCSDVEVVNDAGEVSHRSMVITDYFLRGKAPTGVCPLHPGEGLVGTIAGWFGKDGPKPVTAAELGLPTATAPGVPPETTAAPDDERRKDAEQKAKEDEKPKKRGFWSRVFGRNKDPKKEPDKEPKD